MTVEETSTKFNAAWTAISAVAASVIAFVSTLVASPPTLWRDAGSQPNFISYIVTAIVSAVICSYLVAKTTRRPTTRPVTKRFFLAGLAACIVYYVSSAELSCPFVDNRMSIGWTYLPTAANYIAKNPQLSCSLVIADFVGDTDNIWPRFEIIGSWLIVLALYVIAVSILCTIVVRFLQSLTAG